MKTFKKGMETCYYFQCKNTAFPLALDIFSQFFISPLFTKEYTMKEMKAVNSEHEKNLINHSRRIRQILKVSAINDTPFSKFSTGNLQTLNHESIRSDLIEFFENNYSSNLMKLVMLGNESIDVLEKQAEEYFEGIKNKNINQKKFSIMPFERNVNLKNICRIIPIKDNVNFWIYFFF